MALPKKFKSAQTVRAGGFEVALNGKPRASLSAPRKLLDNERETQVIALHLSSPPPGYATWSLRLLDRRVVELGRTNSISHETVRRTQRRTASRAARCSAGRSRPRRTEDFPSRMEEVSETCAQPCDLDRARGLARRIKFRHTRKHCSWLNIAENELSALTRRHLSGRRIGNLDTLRAEVTTWSTDANERQHGVDWQMTTDDTRRKLKSVHPENII